VAAGGDLEAVAGEGLVVIAEREERLPQGAEAGGALGALIAKREGVADGKDEGKNHRGDGDDHHQFHGGEAGAPKSGESSCFSIVRCVVAGSEAV
jgi:hypothetical protein